MLRVQQKQCETCIYKPSNCLDTKRLEEQIADGYGGFVGSRICHHSDTVTCRGFWDRHKDKFQAGQVAQRMGWVQFVEVDTLAVEMPPCPACGSIHYETGRAYCPRCNKRTCSSCSNELEPCQSCQDDEDDAWTPPN